MQISEEKVVTKEEFVCPSCSFSTKNPPIEGKCVTCPNCGWSLCI